MNEVNVNHTPDERPTEQRKYASGFGVVSGVDPVVDKYVEENSEDERD